MYLEHPLFLKTRTLTSKKDPFLKNQGPAKYAQKHPYFRVFRTLMRTIKHGEWGAGLLVECYSFLLLTSGG